MIAKTRHSILLLQIFSFANFANVCMIGLEMLFGSDAWQNRLPFLNHLLFLQILLLIYILIMSLTTKEFDTLKQEYMISHKLSDGKEVCLECYLNSKFKVAIYDKGLCLCEPKKEFDTLKEAVKEYQSIVKNGYAPKKRKIPVKFSDK